MEETYTIDENTSLEKRLDGKWDIHQSQFDDDGYPEYLPPVIIDDRGLLHLYMAIQKIIFSKVK